MKKINGNYYDVNSCKISSDLKKYNIIDRKTNQIVCTFLAPNRFGGAHIKNYIPNYFQMGLKFHEKYKFGSISTYGEIHPVFLHKYLKEKEGIE